MFPLVVWGSGGLVLRGLGIISFDLHVSKVEGREKAAAKFLYSDEFMTSCKNRFVARII